MVDEATIRCENLSCLCEVSATEGTCSAYCASPAGRDAQNVRCDCGHTVCAKAIEAQFGGSAGSETQVS